MPWKWRIYAVLNYSKGTANDKVPDPNVEKVSDPKVPDPNVDPNADPDAEKVPDPKSVKKERNPAEAGFLFLVFRGLIGLVRSYIYSPYSPGKRPVWRFDLMGQLDQ